MNPYSPIGYQNFSISAIPNIPMNRQNGVLATGMCTLCGKCSICVCQRCGDFYCSPDCQYKDWQRHRYICSRMPSLIHASAFSDSVLLEANQQSSLQRIGDLSTIANEQNIKQNSNNRTKIPSGAQNTRGNKTGDGNFNADATGSENSFGNQKNGKFIDHGNNRTNSGDKGHTNNIKGNTHEQASSNDELKNKILNNERKYSEPTLILPPKPNTRVILTGFRSPNRCCVRSLDPDLNQAYMKVMELIAEKGRNPTKLSKPPKANSYALTKHDGVMHRVKILAIRNEQNIRVAFIDIGTTEARSIHDLYEISDEILGLPQYAVLIQLKNVENYALSDKFCEFLRQYVNIEYKITYSKEDERGALIELINWQNDNNLNDEIIAFGSNVRLYTDNGMRKSNSNSNLSVTSNDSYKAKSMSNKSHNSSNDSSNKKNRNRSPVNKGKKNNNHQKNEINMKETDEDRKISPKTSTVQMFESLRLSSESNGSLTKDIQPVLKPPFRMIQLPTDNMPLPVVITDTSNIEHGYIGCLAMSDFSKMSIVQKYLKKFKDDVPYTPIMDEYIIAQFDDEWYRAKVIDSHGNESFTVNYIDFTNESTVTVEDIRRYPNDLTVDCYTNLCFIEGLPKKMNKVHFEFLKSQLDLQKVVIDKIMRVKDHFSKIECNQLLHNLYEKFEFQK